MEKKRFNMILPKEIKEFIYEKAWQNRTSATAYLISLVKKEMEKGNEK